MKSAVKAVVVIYYIHLIHSESPPVQPRAKHGQGSHQHIRDGDLSHGTLVFIFLVAESPGLEGIDFEQQKLHTYGIGYGVCLDPRLVYIGNNIFCERLTVELSRHSIAEQDYYEDR